MSKQHNEISKRMSQMSMFSSQNNQQRPSQDAGSRHQEQVRKSVQGNNESIFKDMNQTQKSDINDRDDNILGFFNGPTNQPGRDDSFGEEDKDSRANKKVTAKDRQSIENELMVKKRLKSPAKPYNWNKLNDREKSDAFVNTYKNNLELKKKQNELEGELKKMMTNLERVKRDIRHNSRNHTVGDPKSGDTFNYVEVDNLKVENLRLKQKIEALTQVKQLIQQKKSAGPQQKLIKAIKKQEEDRNMAAMSEDERKKLSDMLKMIDEYKHQLKNSEQEIKKLQEMVIKQDRGQLGMTEAQVKIRDLQNKQDAISSHYESNKNNLQMTQAELKELKIKFSKEQMTNQEMRTEIDILKNEIKNYEKLEDELSQVKADKRSVEKQLQQLAIDPLFRDFKDQSANEIRYRETREENFKIKEELKNLKEMNDSLNEKLKFAEKQNLEINDELSRKRTEYISVRTELEILRKGSLAGDKLSDFQQSDFIDALGLVKWDGQDPKWRHLELTEKSRAQEVFSKLGDNHIELKKKIEHLILEKGELGLHLERQATMLRTKIEIDKEKERLHKVEVDQLNQQLKINKSKADELAKIAEIKGYMLDNTKGPLHVYEKDNVKYNKSINEFSTEDHAEEDLGPGENFFDLYIGQIDIDEDTCQRASDSHINMQDILTFFTVDFYNHDTQHTTVVDGKNNNYNFQASYKVRVDEFYVTFLKEKYLKIEFYCVQQQNAVLLGTANISLAQLITENTSPSISAVIEQTVKVRSARKGAHDQFVSCVNLKFRMRYPINRNIEWASEKMKFNLQQIKEDDEKEMFKEYLKKKLVIKIDKGSGPAMFSGDQLFVFFNFLGIDYITPTQIGPNPVWNYENVIEVVVDENFRSMAKNEGIKFILFNDQIDNMNGNNDDDYMEEDIIGTGVMNLKNLIEGDVVYPTVKIIGKNQRGLQEEKGQIHVMVYWYEGWGEDYKPKYEHMLLARDWENKITRMISDSFRAKGLALTTAYYVMNRDQDEHISKEDFFSTIRETLTLKISDEELDIYYHRLPKPFTKQNFESVFRNYLIDTSGYSEDILLQNELDRRKKNNNIEINIPSNFQAKMKNLSYSERQEYEQARIKICALISKKLQNKTPNQIFKDIDEDGNGQVSLFNLGNYLSYAGWKINKEQVQKFLNIIDFNKDGNISLEEFKSFIYNSEGQNQGSIDERQMEHFVSNIKQRILNYLKQNGLSFNDLFKLIDNDRSGFISTIELMIFLLEKLNLKLKFEEIQIIIFQFDKNNDDQIDLYEFIDALRVEAERGDGKYEILFSKERSVLNTIEYICDQLNNYMIQHKKSRGELFDLFDNDSDKFISKLETKQAFTKLGINLTPPQLNEFYQFLDKNGDERVSIQEFISAVKAELNRLEKKGKLGQNNAQMQGSAPPMDNRQNSRNSLSAGSMYKPGELKSGGRDSQSSIIQQSADDDFLRKISKNIKSHKSQYQQQFEKKSKGSNFISVGDFQLILQTVSEDLSDTDINQLTKNIVKTDNRGNIIFSSFLSLDQFTARGSQISENRSDVKTQEQLTRQIFSRIGRILREKKIDYQHAFERIDTNNDRSISLREFKLAFNQMNLNLTNQELEDMFNYIDRNNNGEVTLDEFGAVMIKSQF